MPDTIRSLSFAISLRANRMTNRCLHGNYERITYLRQYNVYHNIMVYERVCGRVRVILTRFNLKHAVKYNTKGDGRALTGT